MVTLVCKNSSFCNWEVWHYIWHGATELGERKCLSSDFRKIGNLEKMFIKLQHKGRGGVLAASLSFLKGIGACNAGIFFQLF